MVHDVGEFVGVLPQAQGVYDGSRRGNPKVGLKMLMPIPKKGSNPVSFGGACATERRRQLPRTQEKIGIGIPVARTIRE